MRPKQLWARLQPWLNSRAARRWLTGLLLLTSAGVLAWMVVSNLSTLADFPWQIRWWALASTVGAYSAALLLAVWAWAQVLAEVAGPRPLRLHLRIYCLTLAAARLPGAPWHLAGRAVLYGQHGIAKRLTSLAAGMELLLIAAGGLIVSAIVIPSLGRRLPVPGWLLWLAAAAILVVLHPTIRSRLLGLVKGQPELAPPRPWRTSALLITYCLIWVAGGVVLFLAILSIYPIEVFALPYVIGAWSLSGTAAMITVFSPSGIGLRDITLAYLLGFIMPPGVAVVAALFIRLLVTTLEIIAAVLASRISVD